jgi:hypothetical protein
LLIFLGKDRFKTPLSGTHTLCAVAHQPLDFVLAFTYIETALEIGIAF